MIVKQIGSVPKSMIDRRLITNEANARAPQQVRFFVEQSLEAELNWVMTVLTH